MKLSINSAVVVAVIALLFAAGVASPMANAQSFPGGFDPKLVCAGTSASSNPNCLIATNGTAVSASTTDGNILRLTQSVGSQDGTAWFTSPQTVVNGFTSTFQFRITPNPSSQTADGIAFVIQNSPSGVVALGAGGGSIGYGGASEPATLSGISNSLAIEFDTYNNGSQYVGDPNANHVAVQSCGTGPNTSWHNVNCAGGESLSTLGTSNLGLQPNPGVILADGNKHTVTIQYNAYNASTPSPCASTISASANLCIYVDSTTTPVLTVTTDLSLLGLTNGTAYIGFTSATGAAYEYHDILNWTFSAQTIVQPVTTTTPINFNFSTTTGATITHVVDFTNSGTTTTSPIQIKSSNTLVSNSTGWAPYVIGTPFAISQLFLKQGDNPTDTPGAVPMPPATDFGSIFTDTCATSTSPTFSDSNCPSATTGYILIQDKSDLVYEPQIAPGTTVGLIEYVQNTIPTVSTWSPSATSPNPACTTVPAACDLNSIFTSITGDPTTNSGHTVKKGTFATVYNVPMPTSSPKINGTPIVTSATNYVHSPLSFDFVVSPAMLPAGYTATNSNGWTAAPVSNLFYTFNTTPIALPTPVVPNCPLSGSCNVTGTTQPGTNPPAPVEFTSAGTTAESEGTYSLQWSGGDAIGIRELNVLLTPQAIGSSCPDGSLVTRGACYSTNLFSASVVVDNTAPTGGATFSPAVSTISGFPNAFLLNSAVSATVSCTDAPGTPGGVFSGVKNCQSTIPNGSSTLGCASATAGTSTCSSPLGVLPTTTPGPTTINFTGGDYAGNAVVAPAYTYNVMYQPKGTTCQGQRGHQVVHPDWDADDHMDIKFSRSVPILFRVCDANGVSVGPNPVISSVAVQLIGDAPGDSAADTLDAVEDTNFHWVGAPTNAWVYNLRTRDLERNVKYIWTLTLNDGSTITFSFTPR